MPDPVPARRSWIRRAFDRLRPNRTPVEEESDLERERRYFRAALSHIEQLAEVAAERELRRLERGQDPVREYYSLVQIRDLCRTYRGGR
jgi:hypothetical protein